MPLLRAVSYGLAGLETAISAAIAVAAGRRWRQLDAGARWIAVGTIVNLAFYAITIPLVLTNRPTRLVNEAPILLVTVAELIGFAMWQPRPAPRRFAFAAVPVFVASWVVGQIVQGSNAEFSTISDPIRAALLIAMAGLTIITRVQATMERWTDHVWFWTSVGYMLMSGTEVLFDPTAAMVQSYQPELALLIHVFRLTLNIAAYGLVLRGFLRAGRTPVEVIGKKTEPVATLTVGSSGTWAIRDL